MTESPAGLDGSTIEAWTRWCDTLERTGTTVLREMLTADAIDVAEGLRHLERMGAGSRCSAPARTWTTRIRTSGPPWILIARWAVTTRRASTSRRRSTAPTSSWSTAHRGSARWFSAIVQRSPAARLAGAPPFGDALFLPDLHLDADGHFELVVAPEGHRPNWVRTDEYSSTLLVRQFFGAPDDVELMELEIENVTRGAEVPSVLTVDDAVAGLDRATGSQFELLLPLFQGGVR